MTQDLPKFDNPPLVEMVVGVEFADLFSWQPQHFGLFWGQIRSDYQQCSIQPPLDSQIEVFNPPSRQELRVDVLLGGAPRLRCWYYDQTGTWLIQVQRNRFIHNWRRTPNGEYPRFQQVRSRFEAEWHRFQSFVTAENLGKLTVNQCEVTYFNHIEPEQDLKLSEIFPCWSGATSGDFLPAPEVVSFNTSYAAPENRGRLYISVQPVFRHADAKEIIQFSATARIIPASPEFGEVLNAIDQGHEWAVRGFTDFTSARMHEIWKRIQ